jgi:hypothetical protein
MEIYLALLLEVQKVQCVLFLPIVQGRGHWESRFSPKLRVHERIVTKSFCSVVLRDKLYLIIV